MTVHLHRYPFVHSKNIFHNVRGKRDIETDSLSQNYMMLYQEWTTRCGWLQELNLKLTSDAVNGPIHVFCLMIQIEPCTFHKIVSIKYIFGI